MSGKVKDSNYCSLAEYIDEQYICKGSGEPCKYDMYPNQYECSSYKKHIKKFDTDGRN